MNDRVDHPLQGLKILELGGFISAAYCTRLLATLGAEVWKLEEPGGDIARQMGPFPGDVPDPDASGLFTSLNVEKKGLTLNPHNPDASLVLEELIRAVDVVVENVGQNVGRTAGWDFERMSAANEKILVTSLSPYGLSGPKAETCGTHLTIFHAGGEGFTLPGGMGWLLYGDREPLQGPSNIGHYDAGSVASAAVLSTLIGRGTDGPAEAELLDVSEEEAQFGLNRVELSRYPNSDFVESRATRALPVGETLQCSDGYVQIEPLEWRMWKGICDAMERPDLAIDDRFKDQASLFRHGAEATQYLAEWAIQNPRQHVFHAAQAHACVAGIVRSPRDLLESDQFREHGFFASVEGTGYEVPYGPHRFATGDGWQDGRVTLKPAPTLGADNESIYGSLLGWSPQDQDWSDRVGLS